MIETRHGDLLKADVDALVNTVNTVGVMGKGIALQFKRAYPGMFRDYEKACKKGEVEVGRMHVWETGALDGPRFIINFPTKKHWRAKSRMSYIDDGLEDLARVIVAEGITSIAIPPLGAGNGGLPWASVKTRIEKSLGNLSGVRTVLYEPVGAPEATEMQRSPIEPLTVGRAALVDLLAGYLKGAVQASLIEVQKLMYFLQVSGELLKLRYNRIITGRMLAICGLSCNALKEPT